MSQYPYYGPPQGPTPPYQGYMPAGPPPPASYAYVPAPVMMPVYQPPPPPPPPAPPVPEPVPQPTYVTNYIYQPPPEPVAESLASRFLAAADLVIDGVRKVATKPTVEPEAPPPYQPVVTSVSEPVEWIGASTSTVSSLTHRAYVAGREGWDGSPLCVIRAHHSGEFVPGKLAIKHRSAYVPHGGREIPVHNFEVLCCPPHAVRFLPSSNGQVPVGAIPAGNSHNGETLYIGRVKHLRSVTPGKVHPSHGCCYISFGGTEHTYKNYEVLCKIGDLKAGGDNNNIFLPL